jgi:polyisoprenoid-binding protein YceI
MKRFLITMLLLSVAGSAFAEWTLDNDDSRLNFISIKAGNIAELHQFRSFSGSLDDKGNLLVDIDLTSVDTSIEVRDGRMREFLFETDTYPSAKLTAAIDMKAVDDIDEGDSSVMTVDANLAIHGASLPLSIEVLVSRLEDDEMVVSSFKPVLVNAADIDLAAGVDKLRELAGLPSISLAVPVTFNLIFEN